jgi:hypothetical protein
MYEPPRIAALQRQGGAVGQASRRARIAAPLKSGGRPFIPGFSSQ